MSAKQMLYLSIYVKGVIIVLLIIGMAAHRVFSQKWFSTIARPDEIKQDLVREKDKIESYNQFGLTGLMFAITLGDLDRVKLLINAGANVNALSKERPKPLKNSVLHIAALHGNKNRSVAGNISPSVEIMKLLLKSKADPLVRNANGDSVIMFLAYNEFLPGRNTMLDMLVKAGADLNTQNNQGKTFIHQMVDRNDVAWFAQVMKKYGDRINLNLKTIKSKTAPAETPLEYAKRLGQVTIQGLLADAMKKKKYNPAKAK